MHVKGPLLTSIRALALANLGLSLDPESKKKGSSLGASSFAKKNKIKTLRTFDYGRLEPRRVLG